MALENIDKMPKTTFKAEEKKNPYRKGFTIICHYFLQWGASYLSYDTSQFLRASKKHQFSTKTIKTKTNSTFIS